MIRVIGRYSTSEMGLGWRGVNAPVDFRVVSFEAAGSAVSGRRTPIIG